MNKTAIGWTDFSSNPVRYRDDDGTVVWACEKVSAGCAHCYSATLAKRWDRGADYTRAEMMKLTPFLDPKELRAIRTSKALTGRRLFLEDMSDLFGAWVPDDLLNLLYSETLELRTDCTIQILTKRADRLAEYLNWRYFRRLPSRHLHHGVSVENLDTLERLDALVTAPSAVRFVSFEPLLEDLGDLSHWLPSLHWAIVGGESGAGHRPCQSTWIRDIVDQCRFFHVPVFVKQGAGPRPGMTTGHAALDAIREFPRSAVPA